MDFIQQIFDHMAANGCQPAHYADLILDDKARYIKRAGDKGASKKLGCCFSEKGGWYHDLKSGTTFTVRMGGSSSDLTFEERAAIARVRENEKRVREAAEARSDARLSKWLTAIFNALPPAPADHPYLAKKGIHQHGARMRKKTGELVLPMKSDGAIVSLQKISVKWKGYQKGGKKRGASFSLATKSDDLGVLVIAEGFATGATIREATGLPVIVAFDAPNLLPVSQTLRAKYPNARIIFAADNDYHGEKNTGREKSQQAALKIGGAIVVWPEFEEDHRSLIDKNTDFNDAARLYGAAYVKNRIMAALEVPVVTEIPAETQEEAPGGFYAPIECNLHPAGGEPPVRTIDSDFGMNFRCLGYKNGTYYYYPHNGSQIVPLSASAHTIQNLMQLDSLEMWESVFGGGDKPSHSKIAVYAANALMAECKKRGVFQEEDRVRGSGAWIDDGRVVLHTGDALYIDGHRAQFREIRSEFTYTAAARLMRPALDALNNYEARRLRIICEAVSWENKLSGSLLAGWLVVAPICAALTFRPHIFVTGESESGKSTVMDKIVKPVLGNMALCCDGETTEPGIRQRMGYDARPLVFDEAEKAANMDAILSLTRLASTGGIVSKFGQPVFKARFSACFSAIHPPVSKLEDENRFTFMVIKKNRRPTALQEYDDLLAMIEETFVNDYAGRMLARTLDNMNALIANIRVFQRAARKTIGGARESEKIGTMLAGLYLLGRTDIATPESAEEWIRSHNWSEHTTINQQSDPMRLIQYLSAALIRKNGAAEISVGELIGNVYRDRDSIAAQILRNYGILVSNDRVHIASTSQNFSKLLAGTQWSIKWSRTLGDLPGAEKEKCVYFARGVRTSSTSIPISLFFDDDEMPLITDADYQEIPL